MKKCGLPFSGCSRNHSNSGTQPSQQQPQIELSGSSTVSQPTHSLQIMLGLETSGIWLGFVFHSVASTSLQVSWFPSVQLDRKEHRPRPRG